MAQESRLEETWVAIVAELEQVKHRFHSVEQLVEQVFVAQLLRARQVQQNLIVLVRLPQQLPMLEEMSERVLRMDWYLAR